MKTSSKLLLMLARRLTAITGPQALKFLFDNDGEAMRRALRAHQAEGFITISTELVRARVTSDPIAVIERGGELPSPHRIAYESAQRWSREILPTLILRGTLKLAALYGGEVHLVVAGHVSHEVALTDVFFSKRSQNPAFEWTLVHAAPGAGALPDAIAADVAIELVGRYNGKTIAAKLGISATHRLELW